MTFWQALGLMTIIMFAYIGCVGWCDLYSENPRLQRIGDRMRRYAAIPVIAFGIIGIYCAITLP